MADPDDNERIADLTYLNELSKGNKQFVKDMIGIFLEENPAEIEMLQQGINTRDFDLINASAHKMRSTVPFVGLNRFIENDISEIETLAVEQTSSQIPREHEADQVSEPESLRRIKKLFVNVREVCMKACAELSEIYNSE